MLNSNPASRAYWLIAWSGIATGSCVIELAPSGSALSHLGLVLAVATPVTAFWRAMRPRLAPHCPRKA
jgi:hypothetical protein